MIKTLFSISLAVLLLNAQSNIEKKSNTNNETQVNYFYQIFNKTNQGVTLSSGNEGFIQDSKKIFDSYIDTTIYSDIEMSNIKNPVVKASKAVYLANNIAYYKANIKIQTQKNTPQKKSVILNVRGYCRVLNDVKVFVSDEFSEVSCDLMDIKTHKTFNAKVFVKFMPDYKREMLIAFPIYAEVNNQRLDSVGYFLNATKTSLNVADKIDSVRIKKLLLKGLLVESDIAYNQAMAYLNDLRASRTQTSVTYVQNGDNTIPVQSQKTEKPKARDYINTGIVQSIAELIKLIGEDSLYQLRPLFYVNKGSVLYTEMILKNNGDIFNKMQNMMKTNEQNINRNNQEYIQNLIGGTITKGAK